MNERYNLTGRKYGKLTVLNFSHKDEKNRVNIWNCLCECGNTKKVWSTALNRKKRPTRSCGCDRSRWIKLNGSPTKLTEGEANLRSLFGNYKKAASERDLPFELDIQTFKKLTSSNCHYCKLQPLQVHKKSETYGAYLYNGIDRLNSNIGYYVTNCVACCKTCNYSKREMSVEEFYSWITRVYKNI